jgi:Predicted 3'-5' exonuclease related to the exonuclease domain of PolB
MSCGLRSAILPVLRYRAMINEVATPGLSARAYFNRYTDDAVDLCDVLSSFSAQSRATLNKISRMMGLPGKPDGIHGGEGRLKSILRYFGLCWVDSHHRAAQGLNVVKSPRWHTICQIREHAIKVTVEVRRG